MSEANFTPIIEPVKGLLNGLCKAIDAVNESGGKGIVVVNPEHGELSESGKPISRMLRERCLDKANIAAGILLREETTTAEAIRLYKSHSGHDRVFIHAGFPDAKGLANALGEDLQAASQIFVDSPRLKLSARHFEGSNRVLIRDGFKRRKNKDYPDIEDFSDLHATFREENMNGFGDFLIVGDEYSDGGALPFVLAIHVTFIDSSEDDLMRVHHFKSQVHATQKDPARKFAEALAVMMGVLDTPNCKIYETDAIQEFRDLHRRKHFPGLGHLKKLSMNHHVQTLAIYLKSKAKVY